VHGNENETEQNTLTGKMDNVNWYEEEYPSVGDIVMAKVISGKV
jgi:hypothetical protein